MKKITLVFYLFFLPLSSVLAQGFCGNDHLTEWYKRKYPDFESKMASEKQQWLQYNRAKDWAKIIISGTDTSYEVPVVVHIIHAGDAIGSQYNPTNTAIDSLLNYINRTWAATWSTYVDTLSGGTYMPIKFVLAKRDPNCNPTTGINRVDASSISGYNTNGICPFGLVSGPSDAEIKNLSIWPARDYLNLWLVTEIEGGRLGGYAPWPWYVAADIIDGVVFSSEFARSSITGYYHYTIPHELGHSFGLYHTFQDGCDATGSCLTEGDQLCDTEPHNYTGGACDMGKTNSCTGKLFEEVAHNFMNYTTCPNRFTKDQRKRVLYTLNNYRMGLVNSLGATVPDPLFVSPKLACIPSIINPSNTRNAGPCKIQFADMITSSSGYNSDGNTSYIDRTCIQQAAKLIKGNTYSLKINTVSVPQSVRAWIDYDNDGVFQTTELVFSHDGTTAEEIHSGSVTVPVSSVVTKTNLRMRIMADYLAAPTACTNVQYGQTEDYTVYIESSASISANHPAENTVRIFPNPASDQIQIAASVPTIINLYSMDGRKIQGHSNVAQIDISNLEVGLYLLEVRDLNDGSILTVQKFLKENK